MDKTTLVSLPEKIEVIELPYLRYAIITLEDLEALKRYLEKAESNRINLSAAEYNLASTEKELNDLGEAVLAVKDKINEIFLTLDEDKLDELLKKFETTLRAQETPKTAKKTDPGNSNTIRNLNTTTHPC